MTSNSLVFGSSLLRFRTFVVGKNTAQPCSTIYRFAVAHFVVRIIPLQLYSNIQRPRRRLKPSACCQIFPGFYRTFVAPTKKKGISQSNVLRWCNDAGVLVYPHCKGELQKEALFWASLHFTIFIRTIISPALEIPAGGGRVHELAVIHWSLRNRPKNTKKYR